MINLGIGVWCSLLEELGFLIEFVPLEERAPDVASRIGASTFTIPRGEFPWITFHFAEPSAETLFRLKYL